MVYDKQTLYKWHSNNLVSANEKTSAEDKRPVGDFHFHNGQWILINRRLPDMKDITDGKDVPIGGFVPLTDAGRFCWIRIRRKTCSCSTCKN